MRKLSASVYQTVLRRASIATDLYRSHEETRCLSQESPGDPVPSASPQDPRGRTRCDDASSLANELRAGGYSTVAVQSGAQVLGRARDDDFDLLILELDLPGSSAQHMLRTMRATGVTAPVIVLSQAGDDAAPLLESGADDHMVTPYHLEELLARVRAPAFATSGRPSRPMFSP